MFRVCSFASRFVLPFLPRVRSFVLTFLVQVFLTALQRVLTDKPRTIIFANIEEILFFNTVHLRSLFLPPTFH